jgi:hypothetical protein
MVSAALAGADSAKRQLSNAAARNGLKVLDWDMVMRIP